MKHREQRDAARIERDSALDERDSARIERDGFKGQADLWEKNNVAQEQFVATLSHDLRNPIGSIKMAVDIIRDGVNEQRMKEMTDLIERNADQAGELINQLLDAHLIRSGAKLPLQLAECDMLTALRKCYKSLPPQIQSRIILSSENKTEIKGFWDARALERAFQNLISNAVKFSDPDKSIQITVSQSSIITRVSIQNFGELISLENQLKIFDSQFRAQQADTKYKKGWGLGLTLVRGIAEAHGGKIEVSSSQSEGTVFTLLLPNETNYPKY